MAARSEAFPWPSHYGHFRFFEDRMKGHSRVANLASAGNGIYELTRDTGQVLRVFICECYSFGVAQFIDVQNQLGDVDVVIINSNWCGYTKDAREHCRASQVGLFTIAEFMGALAREDFWNYQIPAERERDKAPRRG
ncbi:hypothetical protein HJC04_04505 [Rhizobium sp. NLR8a]|uniref:hypothetical protein n=1 Tax=Rhizobium sp. NLR8a TaxID=2731119 RepID=UPI001C840891|nr:hypothetical protein [Rhizobium sp. NLR8a]MBX5219585.1 hypothetical protein [Rhizobium sp. NLR8a]